MPQLHNASPISRHKYGDLKVLARRLLRNRSISVTAVEERLRSAAQRLIRKQFKPREEHAADIALQVMSDVAPASDRAAEWARANGE